MNSIKMTQIGAVLNCVTSNPGLTLKEISKRIGMETNILSSRLSQLKNAKKIETKGQHKSFTYWPVLPTAAPADMIMVEPADEDILSRFTDRELYEELKSRGVVWDRMWKKVYIEYSKI